VHNWFVDQLNTELFRLSNTPVTPLSLIVFLGTLAVAFVLGAVLRSTVMRMLSRRGHAREGLAYALGRITQYVTIVLGFMIGLENVGIELTALAAAGALLTVGIGFGLQNIAQNFISGLILLIERPVQKGDFVVVGNTVGTVYEIAMRATKVISRDGVSIIVPNSELISGTVLNQSAPTSKYRVRIKVGVAYGSNIDLVRDTLLEVARKHPRVLGDPPPTVFFRDFGDSALDFELAVWLDDPQPEPAVTSDMRFAIDRAFRERAIEIPFPQRVLHVQPELLEQMDGKRREAVGPRSGLVSKHPPRPGAEAAGNAAPAPDSVVVEDTSAEEKAALALVTRTPEDAQNRS